MTDRPTASTITDAELDALHARVARAERAARRAQGSEAWMAKHLARQDSRVHGLTRDRDRWRQRTEQAEDLLRIAHETSNRSEAERARAVQRANQLTAALRDLAERLDGESPWSTLADQCAVRIREALAEPAPPGPAATQATDGQVCGAYHPPATSADSGLCARCGMFDYRHGSLAEREHHRAEQLAATLAEILLVFAPVSSHNGVCIGWTAPHPVHPDDMARWDTVLNPPKEQPRV